MGNDKLAIIWLFFQLIICFFILPISSGFFLWIFGHSFFFYPPLPFGRLYFLLKAFYQVFDFFLTDFLIFGLLHHSSIFPPTVDDVLSRRKTDLKFPCCIHVLEPVHAYHFDKLNSLLNIVHFLPQKKYSCNKFPPLHSQDQLKKSHHWVSFPFSQINKYYLKR